jgi:hypothetical protein
MSGHHQAIPGRLSQESASTGRCRRSIWRAGQERIRISLRSEEGMDVDASRPSTGKPCRAPPSRRGVLVDVAVEHPSARVVRHHPCWAIRARPHFVRAAPGHPSPIRQPGAHRTRRWAGSGGGTPAKPGDRVKAQSRPILQPQPSRAQLALALTTEKSPQQAPVPRARRPRGTPRPSRRCCALGPCRSSRGGGGSVPFPSATFPFICLAPPPKTGLNPSLLGDHSG